MRSCYDYIQCANVSALLLSLSRPDVSVMRCAYDAQVSLDSSSLFMHRRNSVRSDRTANLHSPLPELGSLSKASAVVSNELQSIISAVKQDAAWKELDEQTDHMWAVFTAESPHWLLRANTSWLSDFDASREAGAPACSFSSVIYGDVGNDVSLYLSRFLESFRSGTCGHVLLELSRRDGSTGVYSIHSFPVYTKGERRLVIDGDDVAGRCPVTGLQQRTLSTRATDFAERDGHVMFESTIRFFGGDDNRQWDYVAMLFSCVGEGCVPRGRGTTSLALSASSVNSSALFTNLDYEHRTMSSAKRTTSAATAATARSRSADRSVSTVMSVTTRDITALGGVDVDEI